MLNRTGISICGGAIVFVGLLISASPCIADTFTVTITADTNDGFCGGPFPCSLRDAIMTANAHPGWDLIEIPAGIYNLTIPGVGENGCLTGDLDVLEEVAIVGNGAGKTVIDAQGIDRVFHLAQPAGEYVTLGDMTIRGGDSSTDPANIHGGGVACRGGSATIWSCTVESNMTTGHGGGLYQRLGSMVVMDSLIRGNQAQGGSGIAAYLADLTVRDTAVVGNHVVTNSIDTGGAVWMADGTGLLANTTVADNTSESGHPGGVYVANGTTEIESCTLADNQADDLYGAFEDPPAILWLRNSIISGSCNGIGMYGISGNVEGPGDTCNLSPPENVTFADIALHPLGSYGGSTPTMPPVMISGTGNVIIDNDRATLECQMFDQRGIMRPQDGDGDGIRVCDSGAVEYRGLIFGDGFETGNTNRW